jgi:hypothetical protein
LSNVQPAVKTGTQLFQQLGDTQKSQVFLKRKKLFGGPPLTFQKGRSQFWCELFHFEVTKLRRLFMFAIRNGPKNHPVFCTDIFSRIFFQRVDFAKNFCSLTAQQKLSQFQGSSWIRKMLHTDPDSVEKAH